MERSRTAGWILLTLCWLSLWLWSYLLRPLWPIDETRYVSVAWEMWQRSDFVVPYLNGRPYPHKPPLLFWLIHLGWALFGVNEWWPRLVPSLFGLGGAYLTARLAEKLWPGKIEVGVVSASILMGFMIWAVFCTVVMFDLLLAFFALFALLGGLHIITGRRGLGTLMMGVGIGLGILSKGPVIFLHTLPVLCLCPWWARDRMQISFRSALGNFALALALGIMMALLWVIPAVIAGGQEYRNAVLWAQTAHRVTSSFAHRRPIWWYLPWLPIIACPWILFLPSWRAFFRNNPKYLDTGLRFCISWIAATLIIFSLLSGKQLYYLLPMVPAIGMLIGGNLDTEEGVTQSDILPLSIFFALLGAILMLAPPYFKNFQCVGPWRLLGGIVLITLAGGILLARFKWRFNGIGKVVVASTVCLMVAEGILVKAIGRSYDIREAARIIKSYEVRRMPIAHTGKYHGQFHFLGRLNKPFKIISKSKIDSWLADHPRGRVITYYRRHPPQYKWRLLYSQPYRGGTMVILGREPSGPRTKYTRAESFGF